MPRAVEGDHNTRLTLAVPPSDQGMFALAVGEGAADWLSAAAKGPTRSFPADCSTGPPDKLSLRLAATAFGTRFRIYTIATIVWSLAFGAWAGLDAPRVEQGLATPWVGVKERIFWYGYQSWFIVLALVLLREPAERRTMTTSQIKRADPVTDGIGRSTRTCRR